MPLVADILEILAQEISKLRRGSVLGFWNGQCVTSRKTEIATTRVSI
jgi:hypothetical protein